MDKVVFLATKSDTVPAYQRDALVGLLGEMCHEAVYGQARAGRPDVKHVSAIRATIDVPTIVDGQEVTVVQGLDAELGKQRRVTMINIPTSIPTAEEFQKRAGFRTPRFQPPAVEARGRRGIPNIRLGYALDLLLGDIFK